MKITSILKNSRGFFVVSFSSEKGRRYVYTSTLRDKEKALSLGERIECSPSLQRELLRPG